MAEAMRGAPPADAVALLRFGAVDPRIDDLRRSIRAMSVARMVAAAFAAFQVLVYDTMPYPSETFRNAGFGLAGLLGVATVGIVLSNRRVQTLRGAKSVALVGLATDVVIASGFVWLFTFDQLSALWAVLFVLPLEGAITFQLRGVIGTWTAITVLYIGREVWGSRAYPEAYFLGLQWSSVTFRMGLVLLVGIVAGLMARDLVQQRSQLRAALKKVRRVDGLRARLVSTLAHDVRNPLTAIRGAIKMIMSHGDKLDPKTAAELLGNADRQGARLERLASDLLDLARLERGRLELALEEVELRQAVTTALSFADDEGRYEVRIDPTLRVRADPGRLEQIVVNLASNALRYGKEPFVIEAAAVNGRVQLDLRDHGPGVPPEEQGELFEPFRAEQGQGSVGLGLAIVRALARAHGGEVEYRANEPRGACFRVSLPLSGPPA